MFLSICEIKTSFYFELQYNLIDCDTFSIGIKLVDEKYFCANELLLNKGFYDKLDGLKIGKEIEREMKSKITVRRE